MPLENWLQGVWYGSRAPVWLRPLSGLYGAVARVRRFGYENHWLASIRLSRPVVVVGNLSVGGTGKTPLVIWLTEALSRHGYKPGVVSRGYGGSLAGAKLVLPSDAAGLVGDEPLLLAQRLKAPVAVGRDRPRAAQLLIDAGCRTIVSDDGLQHLALQRDCEIVVIDAARGLGNGALLPAGPLRESKARLRSVDAVVSNGALAQPLELAVPQFSMHLSGEIARSLSGMAPRPLASFAGAPVHALAGIGHPERFFALLRSFGLEVIAHPLADHATIGPGEIAFGDGRPVLMTEKDAVKCARFAGAEHWSVPVDAQLAPADAAGLLEIVVRAVERAPVAKGG